MNELSNECESWVFKSIQNMQIQGCTEHFLLMQGYGIHLSVDVITWPRQVSIVDMVETSLNSWPDLDKSR